jgi:hypothetical protein
VAIQLVDKDAKPISSDAKVQLSIRVENTGTPDDGMEIYANSFDVKRFNFRTYESVTTRDIYGIAYVWVIDYSELDEMNKYDIYSYAVASITLTLPDGRSFNTETAIFQEGAERILEG